MKLSDLQTKNETITPLHPEMGDVGVTFEVCSPFSKSFNQSTARIHSELFSDDDGDKVTKWDILQSEALMVGWSGIDDEEGNEIPFTVEKCSEIFRDPAYFWMVHQLSEHLSKKKGYLQTMQKRLERLSK